MTDLNDPIRDLLRRASARVSYSGSNTDTNLIAELVTALDQYLVEPLPNHTLDQIYDQNVRILAALQALADFVDEEPADDEPVDHGDTEVIVEDPRNPSRVGW